jgi:poly-gamma-glutamate capsule biosynthesis protein CapA/YwtB (metallophosphatase superfamily)
MEGTRGDMMSRTSEMRVALTGDCLITRKTAIYQDEPTQDLIRLISEADVSFTNLEVLPNDFAGYPAVEAGGAHLGCHAWVLDELIDMGFNLFGCANNHSLDFSIEGLLAAIAVLEDRGVAYAGVGEHLAAARMPVYFDTPAGSVALISCTSTFATGQEAGEQRPDFQGRPGLNPLRYSTEYHITAEHMAAIRDMADKTGVERERQDRVSKGYAHEPEDPAVFPFLGNFYRVADPPGRVTSPHQGDLDAILKWVREARRRADLVIVSLHAHEQAEDREQPAEFIRTFAHAVIDAGADMLAGHGPHMLRPMEIYNGKPIFYSLGNFVGQNELLYKLPADCYDKFKIDQSVTPGEMFWIRSQGDTRGFPSDIRYWQSVMPVCHYDEAFNLTGIDVYPVTLSLGEANHRRGRPKLATGDEARDILRKFADLSTTHGVEMYLDPDLATVNLR